MWAGMLFVMAFIVTAIVMFINRSRTPKLPEPTLKQLAQEKNIDIGNFAIRSRINEKPYRDILTGQFNLALADNTPNWYFTDGGLRPSRETFFFNHMDEVVNFAEDNNMKVQAHHFLWGEEKWLPDWLKNGDFTHEQLDDLIKSHIFTVGRRYSGRVDEWTVVNEAFTRGQNTYGLRDWWGDHTGGKEYIDKAFRWARDADPNAKLILNDFNNESINSVSDEMYEYIKAAKERGVPIDGIGMQMHIDGTHPPTKDEVVQNMKRFGDLGVRVYVTELDVNMNDVPADADAKDQMQARIYYEMARACIESEVCDSFALLGITDKETWYSHMGLPDPRPLPFDKKYQPKPAFFSLYDAFAQK